MGGVQSPKSKVQSPKSKVQSPKSKVGEVAQVPDFWGWRSSAAADRRYRGSRYDGVGNAEVFGLAAWLRPRTGALRQNRCDKLLRTRQAWIMFGGLRNNLRKHRGKWGIAFSAVFLLAGLFVYEPATPDGVYYDPNMACEHGVWIFKNGTIREECAGETPPRKCGPYFKSKTEWVGSANRGNDPFSNHRCLASLGSPVPAERSDFLFAGFPVLGD